MAFITFIGGCVATLALPYYPLPDLIAWKFIGLSVILHLLYGIFLSFSYTLGDISLVYPIARGTAPLLTTLWSFLFLKEPLTFETLLGIGLICLGIMSLTFIQSPKKILEHRRALLCALITGRFISSYTLIDGIGARKSNDIISYILWLQISNAIVIPLWAASKRKKEKIITYFKKEWKVLTFGGFMTFGAYALVVLALSLNNMASVAALRETSVLFVALLSSRILKEPLGKWRTLAATFVVAGAIIMNTAPLKANPLFKKSSSQITNK